MTNLDEQIEEAIKDGLSNHTGEWFNGFIAPGLSLTEEQSVDLLFYLSKAKRLTNNIKQLMADEFEKMIGEEKVNSVYDQDYIDGWNNCLYELRQKLEEWKK